VSYSQWRMRARGVIRETIATIAEPDRADLELVRVRVRAAYPFGERRHWPYKIWLDEVAKAIAEIAALMSPDPMSRHCAACGATPGKPCREYAKQWEPGTTRPTIEGYHEARSNPSAGPLFDKVSR
jgi:hypothetical protein